MSYVSFLKTVLKCSRSKQGRPARKLSQRIELQLENLENRLVPASIMGDFNNDGYADMATSEVRNGVGEVKILYGSDEGFRNQRRLTSGVANDGFGFALAKGDFNGDGFDDVAIGAPMANEESGVVHIFHGALNGFRNPQHWHQSIAGLGGNGTQIGDVFGFSLAAGNFNGDINPQTGLIVDDLAIGIPGENNASGAVQVLYGDTSGLNTNDNFFLTQDSPGVKGSSESDDQFGFSLAAGNFNGDFSSQTGLAIDDLAVGDVGERFGGLALKLKRAFSVTGSILGAVSNPIPSVFGAIYGGSLGSSLVPDSLAFKSAPAAGRVNVLFGKTSGLDGHGSTDITRDPDGTGISLAAGNFDNDAFDDLVIGNIGNENDMFGAIEVAYGTAENRFEFREGFSSFQQDNGHESLFGNPDQGDLFGVVLAVGNTNNDGYDDLAIGDPLHATTRGAVNVILGSNDGLSVRDQQFFSQAEANVGDIAEQGDFFGADLVLGDINRDGFADLVITVQDGPRGQALNVLYASQNAVSVIGSETYNSVHGGFVKEGSQFFSFMLNNQLAHYDSHTLQQQLEHLQQQFGFRPNPSGFQLNAFGFNEKWFLDRTNTSWAITPDGNLYRWNGVAFQLGTLVDQLDPSVYDNPELLFGANAFFVASGSSQSIEPIRLERDAAFFHANGQPAQAVYIEGSSADDEVTVLYETKDTEHLGDDELVVIRKSGNGTLQSVYRPYQLIVDSLGNSRYEQTIDRIIFEGKDGNDQFYNYTSWPSYALGGRGHDVLTGGTGDDVLIGGLGSDLLNGRAGNDHLRGDDWEYAEANGGHDILYGGSGNNRLEGDSGDDKLYGGDDNDTLIGGFGNDSLHGEGGYDRIEEAGSKLTLHEATLEGKGQDVLDSIEEAELTGTASRDEIFAHNFRGRVIIHGAGDDHLVGGWANDLIYGGDGNDLIGGNYGNNIIYGGAGNDDLWGWDGHDTLYGESGNDILRGLWGNDILRGLWGNDYMSGGTGSDILFAMDGDDTLLGGSGVDWLYGDGGNDYFDGGNDWDKDYVYGGSGRDHIVRDYYVQSYYVGYGNYYIRYNVYIDVTDANYADGDSVQNRRR